MTENTDPIAWLTVDQVAVMLDLKPKTVYILSGPKCTAARRLPSHRLGPRGGKLRFDPADVRAYIEAQRTTLQVKPPRGGYLFVEPKVSRGSSRRQS